MEEKQMEIEIETPDTEEDGVTAGAGQAEKAGSDAAPESGAAGAAETEAAKEETADGGAGETAEAEELPPEEEKGFAGRRAKKELEKKEAELAELTDRYKRTLAEYENFRKRTEKEKADLYSFAVRDVMTKMLPVLDNLERGLQAVPEESKEDPVAQGMDKICKQFQQTLLDIGVKPIEAAGQPFDPNFHNAVMHVDDESLGENIVAEEFQKGYTYRDTVVRHSMVKVAN